MAIFNLMQHGDHLLCCDDVYGGIVIVLNLYSWSIIIILLPGTNRYIKNIAIKHGITCSMIDMSDLKNVEDALLEHRHVKVINSSILNIPCLNAF